MITNIIATILVVITTNTYAPKQYKVLNTYLTFPSQTEESWVDAPDGFGGWPMLGGQDTRDNPDVRITEVRRIKTLSFEFEGKTWTAEIENEVLSSKRKKRIVETNETWVDEP